MDRTKANYSHLFGNEAAIVEMVERETQLAGLARLLDDCARNAGGTAVITGPLASGKSALLRAFAERAGAAGALVLDAVGIPPERDMALGVMRQLFQDAPLTADERAAIDTLLTCDELRRPSELDVARERRLSTLANRRLWSALCSLAERVPVVIAVDDLHNADDASLHSLSYFCERAGTARILVVAAAAKTRATVDRLHGVWLTDLLRQPQFHQVRVTLLSEDGVAAMIAGRLGAATARRLARSWFRLTGGNPLLVLALLEDALAEAPAAVEAAECIGEEYGKSIVACVRRGGRDLLGVARALAVLGDDPAPHLLWRLLDLPEKNVAALLETMHAAGVLDALNFRHPSVAHALLGDMPTAERDELHRRAAHLLHQDGASPAQVAGHLVAAGHAGGDWAFDILYAAAAEALRHDDLEFATGCLDLAEHAAGVEQPERLRTAVLRSRVEFRNNPLAAFRRLAPLTRTLREGRIRPDGHAAALIPPLLWQGRVDEAALVLDGLGDRYLDDRAVEELQVAREMAWSGQSPGLRPRMRAFEESAAGRELVERAPGAGTLTAVLREGPGDEVVGNAEAVLQSLPLDDGSFCALQSALLTLVYADRTDLAAGWCDDLLREASARRACTWQALLTSVRAEISLRLGEPAAAHRLARQALSLISERSWGVAIGMPVSSLILASTALGVRDAARSEQYTLPDAMFGTRFGAQYLYAAGHRHLAEDRAEAALRSMTAAGRLLTAFGIDVPSFVPWRSGAVAALLRLGRRDEARDLAAEQFTRPGADQPRPRGLALRALASATDPQRRPALLEEAADLLKAGGDRVELAYALADLSDVRQRLGQVGQARMAARRAVHLAAECRIPAAAGSLAVEDAPPLLADPALLEAASALEAAAVREAAPARIRVLAEVGTLSAAERRVAELAAKGQTNREISERLFVTVSTVEQHLTRVYRKLKVSGRAGLPTALTAPATRSG